ncbi:MAG TPA: hypothetical protein VF892_01670 [Pseudonocardiaceae bacterium]
MTETSGDPKSSGLNGRVAAPSDRFPGKMHAMAARSGRKHGPRGVARANLENVEARLVDAVEAEAAARGYSRAAMASVVVELGLRSLHALHGDQEDLTVIAS